MKLYHLFYDRDYILAMVEELGSIPINDETYDVVMCSNGFAPGQIYPSAITEILRVMRPGELFSKWLIT